jgi:hypothetical protein
MNEEEILDSLIHHAEDTNDFFSEARKWERECWVCTEFLRSLGLNAAPNQLVKPGAEPPDVLYQSGNFEVFIVHDENRRLQAEWKERLNRYRSAQSLEDTLETYSHPKKICGSQIIDLLMETIYKKYENYTRRGIKLDELDILAYVNLQLYVYDFEEASYVPTQLIKQGWRSIFIFGNKFTTVLYASGSAPYFLRLYAGKTIPIVTE